MFSLFLIIAAFLCFLSVLLRYTGLPNTSCTMPRDSICVAGANQCEKGAFHSQSRWSVSCWSRFPSAVRGQTELAEEALETLLDKSLLDPHLSMWKQTMLSKATPQETQPPPCYAQIYEPTSFRKQRCNGVMVPWCRVESADSVSDVFHGKLQSHALASGSFPICKCSQAGLIDPSGQASNNKICRRSPWQPLHSFRLEV